MTLDWDYSVLTTLFRYHLLIQLILTVNILIQTYFLDKVIVSRLFMLATFEADIGLRLDQLLLQLILSQPSTIFTSRRIVLTVIISI